MTNGWFVFAVVAGILLCAGTVLSVALLKAAWARREREALTSNDLRALEESAVLLIEQLRAEVDQGIAEIDAKRSALESLISQADERLSELHSLANQTAPAASEPSHAGTPSPDDASIRQVLDMAEGGMGYAEIARKSGLPTAEVQLMLRLSGSRQN